MTSPPFGTHERESFFGEFGSSPAVSALDNEQSKSLRKVLIYNERLEKLE